KSESWFAITAEHSKNHAIYDFLQLVKSVENLLKVSFEIKKTYWFKVARQHYGLIKNALAIQYDKEHKKLYISNPKGQWFVIDNSYNLHEAETLSPETANKDMDNVVKPLFDDLDSLQVKHKDFFGEPANATEILNDAKDHLDSIGETLTLSKVLNTIKKDAEETRTFIKELAEANKYMAENLNTHIPYLNKLAISTETQTKSAKALSQEVAKMTKIVGKIGKHTSSSTKPSKKSKRRSFRHKPYGLTKEEENILRRG
ncbi:MAG: hypothetical protein AABY22_26820, partial [Nanoarchaeota archaeon]